MKLAWASIALALVYSASAANAAVMVDTGTPTGVENYYAVSNSQALFGLFDAGQPVLTGLGSWFVNNSGDTVDVTVKFYEDEGGHPDLGNAIAQTDLVIPFDISSGQLTVQYVDHQGLGIALQGGHSYWVGFSSGVDRGVYMASEVPHPLLAYGFTDGGTFRPAAGLDVGLFAEGVPEPASWAMMLGGFGFIGGAMRGRRRVMAAAWSQAERALPARPFTLMSKKFDMA